MTIIVNNCTVITLHQDSIAGPTKGPPKNLLTINMYLGFPWSHKWWALSIQKLQSLFIVIMYLQEKEKKIKAMGKSCVKIPFLSVLRRDIHFLQDPLFFGKDLWIFDHHIGCWSDKSTWFIIIINTCSTHTCILILAMSESLRESKIDFSNKHSWAWP